MHSCLTIACASPDGRVAARPPASATNVSTSTTRRRRGEPIVTSAGDVAGICSATSVGRRYANGKSAVGCAMALTSSGPGVMPTGRGPGWGAGYNRRAGGRPAQRRPRPCRSSIMPSAAPSGPRAAPEAGEHLLLAGQGQAGARREAARSAPISCEMASRRCTSSMISASQASIAPRSSPIRSAGSVAAGRSGGGEGAHRVSFGVLVAVGPRERETPRAPRARGVCCGVCSASGDGHRIPVTVVKADRGEHGPSLPQRSGGRHDRRWGGCGARGRRRGPSPVRLTVM